MKMNENQTFQDIKDFIKPDELVKMIELKQRYPDLVNANLDELIEWLIALIGDDEL
jgi:hypothetical protein